MESCHLLFTSSCAMRFVAASKLNEKKNYGVRRMNPKGKILWMIKKRKSKRERKIEKRKAKGENGKEKSELLVPFVAASKL
jgi:hypothetical protein